MIITSVMRQIGYQPGSTGRIFQLIFDLRIVGYYGKHLRLVLTIGQANQGSRIEYSRDCNL